MGDTSLKSVLRYIPAHLTYFSPCGTNCLLRFLKRRGIAQRFGSIRANQGTLIWWISVHQINRKACVHFITVDRLSEILRPRFNRVFDDSWSNTLLQKETPTKITRAIIVESGNRGRSFLCDLDCPKSLQPIERPAFFASISYK